MAATATAEVSVGGRIGIRAKAGPELSLRHEGTCSIASLGLPVSVQGFADVFVASWSATLAEARVFGDRELFRRCSPTAPAPPDAGPTGSITEFPLSGDSDPFDIVAGPDGNLWFTDARAHSGGRSAIGRITPSGAITEFTAGLSADSQPYAITAGSDGNLWFTGQFWADGTRFIGRITPDGAITEFTSGLNPMGSLSAITAGPDGNLWFTTGSAIVRMNPNTQAITEFTTGLSADSLPWGITSGPDGNLWFTDAAALRGTGGESAIGRITPSGTITEFRAGLDAGSAPTEITTGPDGNLWFTDPAWFTDPEFTPGHTINRVGGINPDTQAITEFTIEDGYPPQDITAGPDGNLWFTTISQIRRITPAGTITRFTSGLSADSFTYGIAAGDDGNLWFTDPGLPAIGRINPAG